MPPGWLAPTPYTGGPGEPPWPSQEVIRLWPGRQPGAPAKLPTPAPTMNGPAGRRELWIRGVAHAEVHVFRPARPNGSSLLSIPGGGYGFVSVQNEGLDVAQHFNALGTTVFVLVYRLPREGWTPAHLAPLQDAQRAMRVIRARAAELRIDPARLGVLGFSAGGHLAADLITAHAEAVYAPVDTADTQSARPAFAGLVYPVTGLVMQSGDRRYANMLAPGMPQADLEARSPVRKVTADLPPTFLVHAADDPLVVLETSLEWIAACRAAKRPVEAHFPAVGGHGFGLSLPKDNPGAAWPDLFAKWIPRNGG
jgi:acetyl esterase/lipase